MRNLLRVAGLFLVDRPDEEGSMRVLAAEDNFITRLDLREMLEAAGHVVCAEARDGFEAVELARSERPDIAFLDFSMPGIDGIEAARRIIAERSIPVVLVTGRRHAEVVQVAAAAGVGGSFLAKPFAEADVLAAVAAAERLHRARVKQQRRERRGGLLARLRPTHAGAEEGGADKGAEPSPGPTPQP